MPIPRPVDSDSDSPMSDTSDIVQQLPQITVQPDFQLDLVDVSQDKDRSRSFWMSTYKFEQEVRKSETGTLVLDGKPLFNVEYIDQRSFLVHEADGTSTVIAAPNASHKVSSKAIRTLAVSPGKELIVCGGDNGELKIIDAHDGSIRRDLPGHVGDVSTVKFFPSGQVILSGASDFQLKIWGLDGSNPVTLKGHTRGILDTAIISRGRNVLSSSADGQVKLWECASGQTIAALSPGHGEVNAISLGEGTGVSSGDASTDRREVDTEGKVVFLATESGFLDSHDLRSKQQ
ncbi:Proteasomal ATPase-associated factor 1, partial [Quaeritorhiza haematococci]